MGGGMEEQVSPPYHPPVFLWEPGSTSLPRWLQSRKCAENTSCKHAELLLFIIRNLQWLIPSSLLPRLAELWRWMTLSDNCCRLARSADADGPRRGEILSHPIGKCSLVQRLHHDDETSKGQSGRAERSRVFINIHTLWLFIWISYLWRFEKRLHLPWLLLAAL